MMETFYWQLLKRNSAWMATAFILVGGSMAVAEQESVAAASIDPAAIAALDRMGAYLRTLKAFRVSGTIQQEHVLESGLKVQLTDAVSLAAIPPNRLSSKVSGDANERQFMFDGKQFTLWAPQLSVYATVDAPPTIRELIEVLAAKFDIDMPLVDLFLWSSNAGSGTGITEAVDIGQAKVGDADCQHFALGGEGMDWQIWIQAGEYPLPRKLVLTTTTDEARPQYQATYTWDLAPSFVDSDFTFDPPSQAHRIVLKQVEDDAKKENN
jgi:hypothetical protein